MSARLQSQGVAAGEAAALALDPPTEAEARSWCDGEMAADITACDRLMCPDPELPELVTKRPAEDVFDYQTGFIMGWNDAITDRCEGVIGTPHQPQ